MEEIELKGETKPKDSVNEMGISEVAKLGKSGSSLVEQKYVRIWTMNDNKLSNLIHMTYSAHWAHSHTEID